MDAELVRASSAESGLLRKPEWLRDERPLGVDEADSRANVNVELLDQRLTERCAQTPPLR
jgi:hypothetical protein